MDKLIQIAGQFVAADRITQVEGFGNGNINDTFLVRVDDPGIEKFILQRINTQVFRQPQLVMRNMCRLTQHMGDRLQHQPPAHRWETPQVMLTHQAQDHWKTQGEFWRAISFIHASQSFDTLHDRAHAQEVGYALGMFHNLISDLPPEQMADTLEGFHITPLYLQQYEKVLAAGNFAESAEVKYGMQFIRDRQSWATVLEDARANGKLPLRLMHGDPKVNNVMFDRVTGKAVSMIDLDTVKPGLVHYDIGDCLRSGCNSHGEETEQWQAVQFDTELCQSLLKGYWSIAQAFLTENDYAYLYDAMRLISFELGLRFFTDYLAGNRYFKVKYPEHNLIRSLVQFKLTESIESQEKTIRTIIRDLR
jgi:Ser/Thr protein kinase RdoA (MazF antagonist)